MKPIVIIICSLFFSQAAAQKNERDIAIRYITQAMGEQEACWNKGDIACFMKHYWKSDSLRFIGQSGLTHGWQQTLDNYNRSYPDKNAMGRLVFLNLVTEFVDEHTVLVIGKWKLERTGEPKNLEGHYSLLWQKKDGNWVIIIDHSS